MSSKHLVSKILTLFWRIFLLAMIFLPFVFGMLKLFLVLLKDDQQFVTLTAYGFAIFLGVSTMLFNWQRSTSDANTSRKLYRYAVDSVLCCFCFLMAMITKYLFSENLILDMEFFQNLMPFFDVLKWTSFVWLLIVAALAVDIFISFFKLYISERDDQLQEK